MLAFSVALGLLAGLLYFIYLKAVTPVAKEIADAGITAMENVMTQPTTMTSTTSTQNTTETTVTSSVD